MNRKSFYAIRLFAFCLCAFSGSQTLHAQSTNAPVLSVTPGAPPALTVTGIPGASYQVQFASQLAASNQWTALTNIFLSNSAYLLHDPATASNAARFYRALLVSLPSNIFNGYAPAQISSGEIYQFVTSSFGMTSTQTLFVSSATNGVWMAPPNSLPVGGATAVGLNFTRLSNLTIQLDVIFPATSTNSPPTTNSYLLAFTGTTAGVFEGPLASPEAATGNFSRITNLTGTTALSQLAAGQVWNFSTTNGSPASSVTLVMDSSANGWWITLGSTGGGISAATAQFTPQGPLGGTLVVLVPAGPTITNTFSVEFAATNSGVFEGQLPGLSPSLGTFTLDTSSVGKIVAPLQLAEGEFYQLSISNSPTPTAGTIAMESPGAGWVGLLTSLFFREVFPAGIQYTQLGPFSASLSITGAFSLPATNLFTNTCLLVYTNTTSGFLLTTLGSQPYTFGTFARNPAFIGQTFAPQQLTTGDAYQLITTSEGFPPGQSFIVNSATDGLWVTTMTPPTQSLSVLDATLQYTRTGPLSATLTAAYPTLSPPSTNTFALVFTGTNIGLFGGSDYPGSLLPGAAVGTFSRNTALDNGTLAPAQLTGGEIYQLVFSNSFMIQPLTQTLVLNSATSGLLVTPGSSSGAGISAASIQYSPLGAFGANLTLTTPTATNTDLLDFASAGGGFLQIVSPSGVATSAGFTRSTALVGQNFAPQQLVDGESFQLSVTNQPLSSPQTLILTSATNGLWTLSGPGGGLISATVQYTELGPLAADLSVIILPGVVTPAGSTNDFTLIFNSATNGVFQNNTGAGTPLPAGTFVHSTP